MDHGILKCSDSTNPTKVLENKVDFKNDGTTAEVEFLLVDSLSITNEHKYSCSVYENNNLLENSNSGELIFYRDIEISSSKKYNEIGLASETLNKIGALVLLENSAIVSNGETLRINAEEIVARPGSKIKSFFNDDIASEFNAKRNDNESKTRGVTALDNANGING